MKHICKFIVLNVICVIFSLPASAASQSEVIQFKSELRDMNRIKPLQNPRHELLGDVLDGNLIDSESKVIGEIEDTLIDEDGKISAVYVVFDRLRLGNGVFLNYENFGVASVSNGYKIGMHADDVEATYPELLANIETAAGAEGVTSARTITGRDVINTKGIKIGKISDILFDHSGEYVRGLHINVNYKTIRDEGVAVPFDSVQFTQKYGRPVAVIDKDFSDLIVRHVKGKL